MSALWRLRERTFALARAERDGVDLLVVGGGISGAGVLRDAASRGLRAFLVERDDFASGTSSASSKMIHGGLRYLAGGEAALTREACQERDLLLRLNPNLVRTVPFLLPSYEGGGMPPWKIRAALLSYSLLANFRRTSRTRMVGAAEALEFCPDLRAEGLRGAGIYQDAQVDDARLVLATLQSARALGAEAANHAELVEFLRGADGRLVGGRVRDRLSGETRTIRAHVIVNATGPSVDRLRGLGGPEAKPELRPAKGVHLVIPADRIPARGAVTYEAGDGRHLFLIPWGDVTLLGTTDTFSDEIDEPVVTIEDVHYVLEAANAAFPRVGLTTNDLCSVFAGVRPLVASPGEDRPSADVSRDYRIYEDRSQLVSVAGGKLTTHRATGQAIVDRALAKLPAARRASAGRSRTDRLPLREDAFEPGDLARDLVARFGVGPAQAEHLVAAYGAAAVALLAEAPPELRQPIGRTSFVHAEIGWCFRTECPATLCDVLERRVRLAIGAAGQGLTELSRIAGVAAEAAGWDAERTRAEALAYARVVRRRYQIVVPRERRVERSAA